MSGTAVNRQTMLLVEDDTLVAEGIAAMLEREGRTVVVCSDAASAEVALTQFPFTHIVTDLQLSDAPFEGVQLIDAARRSHPESRIIAMSGYASEIVKSAALAVGADAFVAKPFEIEQLENAIGPWSASPDDGAGCVILVDNLDTLFSSSVLTTHFQPIVELTADGGMPVHGYEALLRVQRGWPFSDMRSLFDYAARKRRLVDLNAVCVERALFEATQLAESARLFINVDPMALGSGGFRQMIEHAIGMYSIPYERIVLELTECALSYDQEVVLEALDSLRSRGAAIAIDDAESAAANLTLVERMHPKYVKISHHIGSSFHTDAQRAKVVRKVVRLANALAADVVLEGIDSSATLEAARAEGIRFAQGFWIGEPEHASAITRQTRNAESFTPLLP
jgi:EAL domain-containing protein (putative c-di-GMP-specific phosphodiesterase class I)